MALTLYHNDMSVCSVKSRLALAEKGLVWEGVHLNLRAGDTQRPDYLKLNPHAVVPTLVHDGRPIIESTVIGEYIDETWPTPPLRPADSYARASMRLWTKQLDEGLHAATGTVSTCIAFREQWLSRPREDFERWIANVPDPERRERSRSNVEQGMASAFFAPAVRRFLKMLDEMQHDLSRHEWLAGDSYSLADVAYTPYIVRLEQLGFEAQITECAAVCAWRERVMARPSFEPAVAKWFNAGYLKIFETNRVAAAEKIQSITAV